MTAPKPSALKLLNGSAAHHPERRNPAEPTPAVGAVPPPWLPAEGPARDTWDRLAPVLTSTRVLTVADADALGLVCMAAAEYLAALAESDGWRHADSAWKRYAAALGWFGMTPSARTRVAAVPELGADPLVAWMEGTSSAAP